MLHCCFEVLVSAAVALLLSTVGMCSTPIMLTQLVLACQCCANRLTVQCVCSRNASWWLGCSCGRDVRLLAGRCVTAHRAVVAEPSRRFPSDSVLEFLCISTTCEDLCFV
jgi:hypothetical protein